MGDWRANGLDAGLYLRLGPAGVWWGLATGLACAAISLTLAFEWKMRRMLKQERKAAKMAGLSAV